MAETKIEMKVEQEIKPLKELCEKMVSIVKSELEKGADKVDAKELGYAMDMIKDLAEAKKNTVEACYKMQIMSAMEENADDYGETWDEEGPMRKGYRGQPRSKTSGRYMSRDDGRRSNGGRYGYEDKMMMDDSTRSYRPDYDRDMDRVAMDRMYYTNGMSNGGNSNGNMNRGYDSRMERARRNFEEHMQKHDASDMGKKKEMELLGELIDSATEVMMAYKPEMDSATKTMMSKKLSNAGAKVMQ